MRFVQISDVHIYNTARHKEYALVFTNLMKKLKKLKPDRIVVTGDIFHLRTILSPESIVLCTLFFRELASIAPVDVISGNHDVIVNNKDRMNPLAMIINEQDSWDVPHPITLYEETKIYDLGNGFAYGNFSITDEEGYPPKIEDEDNINIALYHGQVDGSRSSTNYVLESKITMELFKEFDFGFFGDIHRPQGFERTDHIVEEEIDESDLESYKKIYPDLKVIE